MPLFDRVALIGVGLIGGSLALEAKKKDLFGQVTASSRRRETLNKALERGLADEATTDPAECVRGADLVVLASPVRSLVEVVEKMSPSLGPETIVTDVGSVKGKMVETISKILDNPSMFIPGHPVAGSEKYGPEAAVEGLFAGRRFIITPTTETDRGAVEKIRSLWEGLGMKVIEMDPIRHDRVLAATSHLPHIVAYALVRALMRMEETDPDVLDFTAGGFQDYTRIASSSAEMWRDIFSMNSENLIDVLDCFSSALDELRKLIVEDRLDELYDRLESTRRFKDSLDGKR